jgi:hypothetical protein
MRIVLIRDDGTEQDITQQITDIEFYETAIKELPTETLREIAQLIAFNRAAYRADLVPGSNARPASDELDDPPAILDSWPPRDELGRIVGF